MHTRVQKWENSLALRIPNVFVKDTGLIHGAEVDIILEDGAIVVRPEKNPKQSLKELLRGITKTNIHYEVETGLSVGGEFR